MSRDSSGIYTLPAGNPVQAGTTIEDAWANSTMTDVASALTDSLSRSGLGGMQAPFKFADGTLAAPGMAWNLETGTGFYRFGAFDTRFTMQGTGDSMRWLNGISYIRNVENTAWAPIVYFGGAGAVPAGTANLDTLVWDLATTKWITQVKNAGGVLPLGTAGDSTLQWNNTAWVENANFKVTAAGFGTFTAGVSAPTGSFPTSLASGPLTVTGTGTFSGNVSLTGAATLSVAASASIPTISGTTATYTTFNGTHVGAVQGTTGSFSGAATFASTLLGTSSTSSLGYGTGAGGTVTQITSKSTPVTLNKMCGLITTHAASLAGGAAVIFEFNNSLYGNTDTIIANTSANYSVTMHQFSPGKLIVRLTNTTGVALAEAVGIVFTIIKSVTS